MTLKIDLPKWKQDDYEETLAKLNKKLAKYNEIAKEISRKEYEVTVTEEDREFLQTIERKEKRLEVILETPSIVGKHNEVELLGIASLEDHCKQIYSVGDVNLHNEPLRCDHCKENRYRVKYFFFREKKTGEIKCVGSTCCQEYFGIDVEQVLSGWDTFLGSVEELKEDEDYWGGGRKASYYGHHIGTVIALTAYSTKDGKWIPKSNGDFEAISTSEQIRNLLNNARFETEREKREREEYYKTLPKNFIQEVLNFLPGYLQNLGRETSFTCNIQEALTEKNTEGKEVIRQYIAPHALGTAAWGIFDAIKKIRTKDIPNNKVNEYLGKIGDKLEIEGAIENIVVTKSYIQGIEKEIQRISFRTTTGHLVHWPNFGKKVTLQIGTKVKVVGTIKDHSDWKGEKQTLLTRAKVTEK